MTTVDEEEQVYQALQDNMTASMGEAGGRDEWASTANIGLAVHMPYGRVRTALDRLAAQGRARSHPSGSDYWQTMPTGGGGPS
jgi:hypothetical protein